MAMVIQLHFDDDSMQISRRHIEMGKYRIPRDCNLCKKVNSVIGHGVRERICLGTKMDVILVRRGRCKSCGTTFTFLPSFARPHSKYSTEVIQETFMRFVNSDDRTPFHSLPDSSDVVLCPDIKTTSNWLHALVERMERTQLAGDLSHVSEQSKFAMMNKELFLGKVKVSPHKIYERFFNAIERVGEMFSFGCCLCLKELKYNVTNFFQAFFVPQFGTSILWSIT